MNNYRIHWRAYKAGGEIIMQANSENHAKELALKALIESGSFTSITIGNCYKLVGDSKIVWNELVNILKNLPEDEKEQLLNESTNY